MCSHTIFWWLVACLSLGTLKCCVLNLSLGLLLLELELSYENKTKKNHSQYYYCVT